jgi:hypothetical protein
MSMNQLARKKLMGFVLFVLAALLAPPSLQAADRVRIAIGTQDTTIN